MESIQYTPDLDSRIRNLSALPSGLRCDYLICIQGEGDSLIAKQWKRKRPQSLDDNEVLICCGNAKA